MLNKAIKLIKIFFFVVIDCSGSAFVQVIVVHGAVISIRRCERGVYGNAKSFGAM